MKDTKTILQEMSKLEDKEQMINYLQNLERVEEVETKHKPQTNADRIRSMTDEELAVFIYTATRACNNYECESCPIGDENCPNLDKWLKQPAE